MEKVANSHAMLNNMLKCGKFAVLCVLIFCGCPRSLFAQDVEAIAKAPVMAASGGIALSQITTYTPTDTNAQKPFAYYLSGNLNLTLLGEVSIPLSFAYSNQQFNSSASLPFNRFSIAPSYKWIKLYAGYSSMNFSPYTLGGHEIFGGGIELTPDNGFRFSAIYGRLRKSVDETVDNEASYRRMGGGFKAEYSHKLFDVSINLSKARDDAHSTHFLNPDSLSLLPQDNLFGGASLTLKMVDNLQLSIEYGFSAINRDISKADSAGRSPNWLFETSGDVALYHAFRTNISYNFGVATVGGTYERVAPNYITLGMYQMTNDFENITANISTSIKNVNLALDGGFQRDDLQQQKTSTTSRLIFSGNLSTTLGQKWSLSANISNLQSYAHIRSIYDQATQTNEFQNLDTLDYTQLNFTASLNASYLIQSSEELRQSINGTFMYQRAAEKQGYNPALGNDIYNGALAYQFSQIPSKFNASLSLNYNLNQMTELRTTTMSYSLSVQKTFFSILKSSFIGTYSHMRNGSTPMANIVNLRFTAGCTLLKRHNLSLSLAMVNSQSKVKTNTQYSSSLSYSYNFSASLQRKSKKWAVNAAF